MYIFTSEFIAQKKKERKVFTFLFIIFMLSLLSAFLGVWIGYYHSPLIIEIGMKIFFVGICFVGISFIIFMRWKEYAYQNLKKMDKA